MGLHYLTKRHLRRHDGDHSRQWVVTSCNRINWVVRADMRDAILGVLAPDWLALRDDTKAVLVETGHQRTVWHVRSRETDIFAKVSRELDLRNRIKSKILGTHSEREWRVLMTAAVRKIPVPRLVAVGVAHDDSTHNVLLTAAIPQARPLTDAWQEVMNGTAGRAGRQRTTRLIDEVASLIRSAHDVGFSHRDGHPNNILVAQSEAGAEWRAFFVDTLGARLTQRPIRMNQAAISIAQLDQYFHRVARPTDRLRFLRAYRSSGQTQLERTVVRQWTRETVALVAKQRRRLGASLARLRDRRLKTDNKYFAQFRFSDGWRAKVVLRLERRHVFPEKDVPDRTVEDWQKLIQTAFSRLAEARCPGAAISCGDVEFVPDQTTGFSRKLLNAVKRSEHRRVFESCHRSRHRDIYRELILGYAEQRSAGLVVATMMIRPLKRKTPVPAPFPDNCESGVAVGESGKCR